MLSVEELKHIKKIPTEDEISLKIITQFYEIYISNRIYELELENGTTLIFATKNKHFPHLLSLHKFHDAKKLHSNFRLNSPKELRKETGFNNLKNGDITIEDLKKVNGNTKRYKQYKKRILNFPFSYQLLRTSVFVSYDKDLAERETTIKGDYIFVNDIENNKLHFFFVNDVLDDDDKDRTVPLTFIVQNESDFMYTSKQDKLKINKIVIKDLITKEKLEEYNFTECSESVIRKKEQESSLDSIVPKEVEKDGHTIEEKIILE